MPELSKCMVCFSNENVAEQLFCTRCECHYHVACLTSKLTLLSESEPHTRANKTLTRLGWQCPECKVCQMCR